MCSCPGKFTNAGVPLATLFIWAAALIICFAVLAVVAFVFLIPGNPKDDDNSN
jgi:hypothetical protein